jgi:hypothetical protein
MTLVVMQTAAALVAAVFGVKFAVGVWAAIVLRGLWITPFQSFYLGSASAVASAVCLFGAYTLFPFTVSVGVP